jgi:hypothetical protein
MSSSVPSPRPQIDQVFDRGDKIAVGENSFVQVDIDAKLLVKLVTPDSPEIVFLRIEKQPLQSARAFATVGGSPGRNRR